MEVAKYRTARPSRQHLWAFLGDVYSAPGPVHAPVTASAFMLMLVAAGPLPCPALPCRSP